MGSRTKKVILFLVLAFFIYAIFTSPDLAADIILTIWDILVQALLRPLGSSSTTCWAAEGGEREMAFLRTTDEIPAGL